MMFKIRWIVYFSTSDRVTFVLFNYVTKSVPGTQGFSRERTSVRRPLPSLLPPFLPSLLPPLLPSLLPPLLPSLLPPFLRGGRRDGRRDGGRGGRKGGRRDGRRGGRKGGRKGGRRDGRRGGRRASSLASSPHACSWGRQPLGSRAPNLPCLPNREWRVSLITFQRRKPPLRFSNNRWIDRSINRIFTNYNKYQST